MSNTLRTFRTLRITALLGLLSIVASLALVAGAAEPPTAADYVGRWQGKLEVSGQQLRIVFDVNESEKGGLEATMDSPDQGATGIPIATTAVEDGALRLEVQVINATYAGQLGDEGKSIAGEWRQSGYTFPLTVERVEKSH